MTKSKKTLYLHWGPGSHCSIEREAFAQLEEIEWWDQPKPITKSAMKDLLSAAEDKFLDLAERTPGHRIHLLAHSFGGQIAYHLSTVFPDQISGITLMACNSDTFSAFRNLAARLLDGVPPQEHRELAGAFAAAKATRSQSTFWPLISAITQIPEFMDAYWGRNSGEARARYHELAQRAAPLDLEAFGAIMNSYLSDSDGKSKAKSPFQGPVNLLLGADDPLTRQAEEISEWKRIFPQLSANVLAGCGHFISFESSPASWRP